MPAHTALPDLNDLDSDALKALVVERHALVVEQHAEILSHKNEIESLKLLILKLQRMQFGTSSEKLARHIDQLQLRLEDLETNRASQPAPSVPPSLTSSSLCLLMNFNVQGRSCHAE